MAFWRQTPSLSLEHVLRHWRAVLVLIGRSPFRGVEMAGSVFVALLILGTSEAAGEHHHDDAFRILVFPSS